ncbi:unnamed protein product [Leptidea sinapis]|uniref:Uncharacterized protein n=1 Tax=Leptidea sinapis TaxID=189913 RepID=A0A5E4R7X5_9NEOP|nr:unnamed protein product [Leptidea sinapis]
MKKTRAGDDDAISPTRVRSLKPGNAPVIPLVLQKSVGGGEKEKFEKEKARLQGELDAGRAARGNTEICVASPVR